MMSLLSISNIALKCSERTAIIYQNKHISYAELLYRSEIIASVFLAAHLKAGDRVAIHSGNHPDLIAVYYACLMTGAVFVPLNLHLIDKECQQIIDTCAARFYIGDLTRYSLCQTALKNCTSLERRWILGSKHCPEDTWPLEATHTVTPPESLLEEIDSAQPASIFFTSGTTGHPKGFLFNRNSFNAMITTIRSAMASTLSPDHTRPFYSMVDLISPWSIQTALTALSIMQPVLIADDNSADSTLSLIETYPLSWLIGTPSAFTSLLASALSLQHPPSLHHTACVSGADTCSPALARRFQRVFGAPLQNAYGQTEQGCMTVHHPNLADATVPSLGWPLPTVNIKIVSDDGKEGSAGELFIRAPTMTAGLWTDTGIEPIGKEGWIPTGDLVRQQANGCLESLGRQKDLIKVAGYPVYPQEIEEVLLSHSDISEAVVFAIPDEIAGEAIIAMIKKYAETTISVCDVKKYLAARISHYKIPSTIKFIDNITKFNNKKSRRHIAHEYIASFDKETRPLK